VRSPTIVSSDLEHPEAEACILEAVGALAFPEPRGGGAVVVTYPFLFRSTLDETDPD
jgi:hypothetical protein